jgi:very-short-patch-repair endonuclease
MRSVSDVDRIRVPLGLSRQMIGVAREFRMRPTVSEERLWSALRNRQLGGAKFRRQQVIGPFVVDFFCPEHRLIVEVDGAIHDTRREHDEERQRMLEACGYAVIRASAHTVETGLSSVLAAIVLSLNQSGSPSPLDGEGAGG